MDYSYQQFTKDLAHYIKPYKKFFILGVFLRIASDLSRLYPVWALSYLAQVLTQPRTEALLQNVTGVIVLLAVTSIIVIVGHNGAKYFGYQSAERAGLDLYRQTLAHVFTLDMIWQEKEASGNKLKRIERGRDGVNEMIRRVFDVIIEAVVNTIGIVFIFFTLEKFLSVSLIFFIIIYFLIGTVTLRRASRQERKVNKEFEQLSGISFESLNNIHTIKSLGIQKKVLQTVSTQMKILVDSIRLRIFYFRMQSISLGVFYYTYEVVLVSYLVWGILHGQFTVSLLILFIGLFQKVGQSTTELTDLAQEIVVNKIWVSRAMELLKTEPIIENRSRIASQAVYPENWQELSIKRVNFTYRKSRALSDVSLTIKRGESVGIVGLSGAGKSTLFKLLLDLYEDYDGEILLDDTPLKSIKRQSYIDHLAVVLQDTELFNLTLGENIKIAGVDGRPSHISLDDAISMAHLKEVVSHLPQGVDTVVGEKGTKLSGGQRQRVGIARALYREPDILLLDEATSHLDGESERQIQQALAEVMHHFTTIVIAHRLSTIQKMDKIIVLEKGRVKEMGTFQELIKQDGSFAKMWKMQKL